MSRALAQIEFTLHWDSELAHHRDGRFAPRVNFWRDILPPALAPIEQAEPGTTLRAEVPLGDSLPEHDPRLVFTLRPNQFDGDGIPGMHIEPRAGRYYPVHLLSGLPGFFKGDRRPAYCREAGERLVFDLNHPLAGRRAALSATLLRRQEGEGEERGGLCFDWAETTAEGGPGMQGRDRERPRPAFAEGAFARMEESPDGEFYATTRTLPHVDGQASAHIARVVEELIAPRAKLLDLMSSVTSHLPAGLGLAEVVGLGMNREELELNSRLTEARVHDLNADPRLPFEDTRFDAVTCHLSVEYLTDPQALFAEVARVLRPQGVFLLTFSNRWFPPKVIRLWQELHDYERMGLVLDHFLADGRFTDLNTWSMRGYPRPAEDRYAAQVAESDPVYAVWGRRR